MSVFGRTFQPTEATQNAVMDGTAKTITLAAAGGDKNSSVHLAVSGTSNAFVRVDGVTPTITNALCLIAGATQSLSLPPGATTIKLIGAAGSTVYVTAGRGA